MRFIHLLIAICIAHLNWGQEPIDCDGRIFRVLEQQGGSILQELKADQSESFKFIDLQFFATKRINAIGFRESDGLIYGLLLGDKYTLCRIDNEYQLEEIRELPEMPSNFLFVASDITPDSRYMVIFGYSPDEPGNLLALVDLTSDVFATTIYLLSPEQTLSNVKCADIAFHPTTHQLFGYDHFNRSLIEIDLKSLRITRVPQESGPVIQGNVPSLFFDVSGNLYGIGSEREVLSNRFIISFSLHSKDVHIISTLAYEGNQDACSCSSGLQLFNRVSHRNIVTCTENQIMIDIINYTGNQYVVSLFDTFPAGIKVVSLETQMSYKLVKGLGTNILQIDGLVLDRQVDSIKIKIYADQNVNSSDFPNQVFIKSGQFTEGINGGFLRSDDPDTFIPDDPTLLHFRPLDFYFDQEVYFFCRNDSLRLEVDIPVDSYQWSDDSDQSGIWVKREGRYGVTLKTGCDIIFREVLVKESFVDIEVGESQLIDPGAQVVPDPEIISSAPIISYWWSGEEGTISCLSCSVPQISPQNDGWYTLFVRSEDGCEVNDSFLISIREFKVYIPNAFTPDGNYVNDIFRVYSQVNYRVLFLRIYDRWGNKIHESNDFDLNDDRFWWDGRTEDRDALPGLYTYQIAIKSGIRTESLFNGEVYLIR